MVYNIIAIITYSLQQIKRYYYNYNKYFQSLLPHEAKESLYSSPFARI